MVRGVSDLVSRVTYITDCTIFDIQFSLKFYVLFDFDSGKQIYVYQLCFKLAKLQH